MGGAARIAGSRRIFRFTTFARAADWEAMLKKISSRYAQVVTEPDTFIVRHHRANRVGGSTVE